MERNVEHCMNFMLETADEHPDRELAAWIIDISSLKATWNEPSNKKIHQMHKNQKIIFRSTYNELNNEKIHQMHTLLSRTYHIRNKITIY